MPLVTTKEMFRKAYDGGYAIGAFNVNNMEIVQGITEAAREVARTNANSSTTANRPTSFFMRLPPCRHLIPDRAIVLMTFFCIRTNSSRLGTNITRDAAAASPCPATLLVLEDSVFM